MDSGEYKMNYLLELFAYAGPIVLFYCIYRGVKGSRIIKNEKVLPAHLIGLGNSMSAMTGTERKWGLKR